MQPLELKVNLDFRNPEDKENLAKFFETLAEDIRNADKEVEKLGESVQSLTENQKTSLSEMLLLKKYQPEIGERFLEFFKKQAMDSMVGLSLPNPGNLILDAMMAVCGPIRDGDVDGKELKAIALSDDIDEINKQVSILKSKKSVRDMMRGIYPQEVLDNMKYKPETTPSQNNDKHSNLFGYEFESEFEDSMRQMSARLPGYMRSGMDGVGDSWDDLLGRMNTSTETQVTELAPDIPVWLQPGADSVALSWEGMWERNRLSAGVFLAGVGEDILPPIQSGVDQSLAAWSQGWDSAGEYTGALLQDSAELIPTTFEPKISGLDQTWAGLTGDMGLSMSSMFSGVESLAHSVLGGVFTGEINSLGDAWDTTVSGFSGVLDSALDGMLSSLAKWGQEALGGLLNNLTSWLKSLLGGLDLGGFLGDLLGGLKGMLGGLLDGFDFGGLGDLLGGFFDLDLGGLLDFGLGDLFDFDLGGLADQLFGAGGLDLGDMLGDLLGSGLGDGVSDFLAALGQGDGLLDAFINSDLLGGLGDLAGQFKDLLGGDILSGVKDLFSGDLFSGLENLFGGGGMNPVLMAGAGIFGGVELFASLMGMPGPTEGISNAIGTILGLTPGGGHSQASAQDYMRADMEYLQRAQNSEGGFSLQYIQDSAVEIERIAERAGISAQEVDLLVMGVAGLEQQLVQMEESRLQAVEAGASELQVQGIESEMEAIQIQIQKLEELGEATGIPIEGLGLVGAAMFEAAQASELLNHQVDQALVKYHDWDGGAEQVNGELTRLVGVLGQAGLDTSGLSQTVSELTEDLLLGDITAEQVAERMDKEFKAALEAAAKSGELTAEQMRQLAAAIEGIPNRNIALDWHWANEAPPEFSNVDNPPEKHLGGLIMHQGGWLSAAPRYHRGSMVKRLSAEEVPIIAQRGEYVVRADSVTAATLPWLQALNQTGRPMGEAGGGQMVNLHVEVHGNLLGSEENLEDLARLIEGKLKDIERRRIHA